MPDEFDIRTLPYVNAQRVDAVEQRLGAHDEAIKELRADSVKRDERLNQQALDIATAAGFSGNFKFIGGAVLVAVISALIAAVGGLFHQQQFSQQVTTPPVTQGRP